MEAGDGSGFFTAGGVEAVFGFLLGHLLGRQSLPLPSVRGPSSLFYLFQLFFKLLVLFCLDISEHFLLKERKNKTMFA
jgi:hypothetical protein